MLPETCGLHATVFFSLRAFRTVFHWSVNNFGFQSITVRRSKRLKRRINRLNVSFSETWNIETIWFPNDANESDKYYAEYYGYVEFRPRFDLSRLLQTNRSVACTHIFLLSGLAHSWGTSFSRALPSTAYPPYLANNCGPPTFQHSNFTNIFPYSGSTTEVIQQTINTNTGNAKYVQLCTFPTPSIRVGVKRYDSAIGTRDVLRLCVKFTS